MSKDRSAMHSAVRKVLEHHRLTRVGDGVFEADLIDAVLGCLDHPNANTVAHTNDLI
jgi:hypothetical protein